MNNQINQLGAAVMQQLQANNLSAAESLVLEILKIDPNEINALKIHAFILANLNRLPESIARLKQASHIQKNDPEIFFNLGKACFDSKLWPESIEHYKTFLSLGQIDPLVLVDIGTAHKNLNEFSDAIEFFDKALKIDTACIPALVNKSAALIDLKDYEGAISASDQAIQLNPSEAAAWNNKGNALVKQQHYELGIKAIERALALNPNFVEAMVNLANALSCLKQNAAALEIYEKAALIEPDNVESFINLGGSHADLKQYEPAITAYEKAASINPDFKYLKGNLLHLKSLICLWDETYDSLLNSLQSDVKYDCATPFPLLSRVDKPGLHKAIAEDYISNQFPENQILGPIAKYTNPKIRIAYFSADFRNHPVSFLIAELFELHNKSQFELFGFYLGPECSDEIHFRIAKSFDQFISVSDLTDIEIAKLSRDYKIDIAIDLGGFTQGSRTGIFSYRAAPIQINYLGFPGTMGANYFDYIIGDDIVTPNELSTNYTEKIAKLKCFQPNDSKKEISTRVFSRTELGLPENGLVFACFNNSYKINPEVFSLWMKILSATPGSTLLLSADNALAKRNLLKQAQALGVDQSRIVFTARVDALSDHLARQKIADLFLDTFPYNAHTTASDALWAGLPVLTMAGKSFASRVAASLLTAIGMPELITHTPEEYEALAIDLANNPAKLQGIKEKLAANRLTTPLFDSPRFTQDIEHLYMKMYERYQSGLEPVDI